jgi:hypothetical protein
MQDEPLTPEERAALAALPRDVTPQAQLEDRVVAGLHRAGLLRAAGRGPVGRSRLLMRLAAALALVAGGIVFGRWTMAPAEPAGGRSFLLLLYGDAVRSGTSEQALVAEYGAWADGLRQRQQLIAAERLQPATRVIGNASAATQFAPVGFFLIRADSFESAAATAADCPHARYGGTVVVRPAG